MILGDFVFFIGIKSMGYNIFLLLFRHQYFFSFDLFFTHTFQRQVSHLSFLDSARDSFRSTLVTFLILLYSSR